MKIYNGGETSMNIPLTSQQRLTVDSKKVSLDFLPNPEFLALLVSCFSSKEIAIIAGGPFELAMCSNLPVSAAYVVQSVDEAVQRFSDTTGEDKKEENLEKVVEKVAEPEIVEKEPESVSEPAEELVEEEAVVPVEEGKIENFVKEVVEVKKTDKKTKRGSKK